MAILEAHLSVLSLKEPPPSVIGWTITALEHMYNACTEGSTVSTVHFATAHLSQTLTPFSSLLRITSVYDYFLGVWQ